MTGLIKRTILFLCLLALFGLLCVAISNHLAAVAGLLGAAAARMDDYIVRGS